MTPWTIGGRSATATRAGRRHYYPAQPPGLDQYRMVPAGRWPLWLAPGLWGAGLGALLVGLVWGVSAWL